MDLGQIWHDAIAIVKSSESISEDPRKQSILGLIEFQARIEIINSDLCIICNNDYTFKIIPDFAPFIYMEAIRLIGNDKLGFKLMLASEIEAISNPTESSPKNISNYSDQNEIKNIHTASHIDNSEYSVVENVINPNKTFENYVPDPENKLVVAIAQKIAEDPGSEEYNPFYVYGGSGLGKTHLLWAIANRIIKTKPNISVVYIRAEDFINKYVESLVRNKNEGKQIRFKESFTKHDVFIMDDIQSLTKGQQSREAFFDIIADFLDKKGSQLILASDVAPGYLKNFSARLVSRFGSGLCREIYPPSVETRAAIILTKCKELNITLPQDIIDYISTNIRSSVREIEGAIKTLKLHIEFNHQMITYDNAVKLLSNLVNVKRQLVTLDNIKDRVAKEYNVTVESMESASRKRSVSLARSMAMTIASNLIPTLSLTENGRAFNKDHSSAYEAIKRTKEKIEDPKDEQSIIYNKLVLSLKKD